MTKATEKVYQKIIGAVADESSKLSPSEYHDLLSELQGHLQCLMDCWNEENPD